MEHSYKFWNAYLFGLNVRPVLGKKECQGGNDLKLKIRKTKGSCLKQNLHWKLGQETKLFCFDIDNGLKNICFRNNIFLFSRNRKLKLSASVWKRILWNLTKFQLIQTTNRKNENNNCLNDLNELKFCEVSQNSFSNRCWKFQRSTWKTKKVYSYKKYFLGIKLFCFSR